MTEKGGAESITGEIVSQKKNIFMFEDIGEVV